MNDTAQQRAARIYRRADQADLAELTALTRRKTDLADYPLASAVEKNVLIYDCDNANAAIGENCNEARTAWSAWSQIQGTPRLWGHLTLEP